MYIIFRTFVFKLYLLLSAEGFIKLPPKKHKMQFSVQKRALTMSIISIVSDDLLKFVEYKFTFGIFFRSMKVFSTINIILLSPFGFMGFGIFALYFYLQEISEPSTENEGGYGKK